MEKARRYGPRYLGNVAKDSDSPKKIDQEDWRSCRKRCRHLRERETVCRIEEPSCQTTRSWGCWITVYLSIELEREDKPNESNGCRVEHVLSLGQWVQVRDWETYKRIVRHEEKILWAEEKRADAERGLVETWTQSHQLRWSCASSKIYRWRFQSCYLKEGDKSVFPMKY